MINKLYEKIKIFLKENYKFFIVLAILIFSFYFELPYIIYKSGGTIDLKDRVEIDTNYKTEGSLSMSYVNAVKGTPAFILLSFILPDWDLIPLENVTNGESYNDVLETGKIYLQEGIDNAKIAAFKAADAKINITKVINTIEYISPMADTDLKIGDELLSIDDVQVKTLDDIHEYLKTLNEEDEVTIRVNNNGQELERKAKIYKDVDDLLKIGIAFKTTYEYETEIPVNIKMKSNESGSSGGLMMSLSIYNSLTEEDITKGYNIVGTGTIDALGNVGEIGGVKYKVLGASKKKADIFLCPMENLEEALDIKEKRHLDMEIKGVKTLEEAINYLKNYEG